MTATRLEAALESAVKDFGPDAAARDWNELGLDSFSLLSLRLSVEEALGRELSDSEWLGARRPADLLRLEREAPRAPAHRSADLEEEIVLGMPQMTLGGLSESWLFRHLGDLHWRLVGQALGVKPHEMQSGSGGRIFPAFNRVRVEGSAPLAGFREGDTLRFDGRVLPAGGGIFFAEIGAEAPGGRRLAATLMSTLVAPAGAGGRLAPAVPAAELPADLPARIAGFAAGFAERRTRSDPARPVLDSRPYALQPQYDVNALGLLYCAAYPMIADLSEMAASGRGAAWAAAASTRVRDVYYFGNVGLDAPSNGDSTRCRKASARRSPASPPRAAGSSPRSRR
jgi:probable biosynthetic protein (TIGR04098 family)